MASIEEILSFIEDRLGIRKPIHITSDLYKDHDVYGDDFWDFIEAYSEKFEVDVSNFLWYFHSPEEGSPGIGGIFFRSPDQLVERIPISPQMLLEFANKGFWDIDYPEQSVPEKRWDLTLNAIFALIVLVALVIFFIWEYFFRSS